MKPENVHFADADLVAVIETAGGGDALTIDVGACLRAVVLDKHRLVALIIDQSSVPAGDRGIIEAHVVSWGAAQHNVVIGDGDDLPGKLTRETFQIWTIALRRPAWTSGWRAGLGAGGAGGLWAGGALNGGARRGRNARLPLRRERQGRGRIVGVAPGLAFGIPGRPGSRRRRAGR